MQRQPLKKGGKLNRVCGRAEEQAKWAGKSSAGTGWQPREKNTNQGQQERWGLPGNSQEREEHGTAEFQKAGLGPGKHKRKPSSGPGQRPRRSRRNPRPSVLPDWMQIAAPPPHLCPHAAPGCTTSRKRKKDQRDISAYFAFRL